jgi:tetratricopeptide (TPR) repeat protein
LELGNLGNARQRQGALEQARACYAEALALARGLGDKRLIASGLEGLAEVASAEEDFGHATRLFAAAEALRAEIGVPLPAPYRDHYDGRKAAARDALGDVAFSAAWSAEGATSLAAAIAGALAGDDDADAGRSAASQHDR